MVQTSNPKEGEDALHVPLATLWAYSRREVDVTEEQFNHVLNCEECISAMGLCHILPTINRVEEEFARCGFGEKY